MSIYAYFVKRVMARGDRIKNQGLRTPDDIQRFDDIVYGKDPKTASLDLYRPKSAQGKKLPIIVSVQCPGESFHSHT